MLSITTISITSYFVFIKPYLPISSYIVLVFYIYIFVLILKDAYKNKVLKLAKYINTFSIRTTITLNYMIL